VRPSKSSTQRCGLRISSSDSPASQRRVRLSAPQCSPTGSGLLLDVVLLHFTLLKGGAFIKYSHTIVS
jgi:hypothetical protein